jgi:hypothetical protein
MPLNENMPQDELVKPSTLQQKESVSQYKDGKQYSKEADQTLDAFINALNSAVKRDV